MNSRTRDDAQHLFEFWCEIEPIAPSGGGQIVKSFPKSFVEAKVLADVVDFAYPCELEPSAFPLEFYSFVLTNVDSKWRFGFVRHDRQARKASVIITYFSWYDVFTKYLNLVAGTEALKLYQVLEEAYRESVPPPSATVRLKCGFSFVRPSPFQLPSIPENHNLNLYYNFVEPKLMIGVFCAMLFERRLIFTSARLDVLSSCVQAANAFLYPMVWQHIFIPILPAKMRDILSAPMPYLIGVPASVFRSVRAEEVGDVVILDCDKRTLASPFDDVRKMPAELLDTLKRQLGNPADHRGDRVSKIFLGVLVQLIGGYRDALRFRGEEIVFDEEIFIDSRPAGVRDFLRNMLQLQIFQQFVEERLEMLKTGQSSSDEFEMEALRYMERASKKPQLPDMFRSLRNKANPAVKSAVKSVKEGGKTAYKGIRSKFREQNHHNHHGAPPVPVRHPPPPPSSVVAQSGSTFFVANDLYDSTSPASSGSSHSSEMDMLADIMSHPLMRQPLVDRSLKPSEANDLNGAANGTANAVEEPLIRFDDSDDEAKTTTLPQTLDDFFSELNSLPPPPLPPRTRREPR